MHLKAFVPYPNAPFIEIAQHPLWTKRGTSRCRLCMLGDGQRVAAGLSLLYSLTVCGKDSTIEGHRCSIDVAGDGVLRVVLEFHAVCTDFAVLAQLALCFDRDSLSLQKSKTDVNMYLFMQAEGGT